MSFYDDHILPHLTHLACSSKPARQQRRKVVPHACGTVLEIGFGSGLNLPFYDRARVDRIWGLEPSQGMRRKAQGSIRLSGLSVELIELPGEEIPLDANSVDTIVMTYTLCTIPEPIAALEGMRRVLKPGGTLLYCEHGVAPDARIQHWQSRLNPVWRRFAGGCNMNRDIPALLCAGGFRITRDKRMYIPGPRILSYNYWGAATDDQASAWPGDSSLPAPPPKLAA